MVGIQKVLTRLAADLTELRCRWALVAELRSRGYAIETLLEQESTGRLATVRLLAPGEEPGGIITDLLFASSGIELEVVEEAELLEVLPTALFALFWCRPLLVPRVFFGSDP